jgi:cationic peptide transport system ATP-binding protein
MSDQVMVLHHGQVVEYGQTEIIFNNPISSVTQRLLCF